MRQTHFRDVRSSPEWAGTEFLNAKHTENAGLKAMFTIVPRYWGRLKGTGNPGGSIPVKHLSRQDWPATPDADLAFTWLGHAAYMVEIEGHYILLDPMLGPNPSPVYGMGPARLHPSPALPEELPQVDAVILSHDHYDHLDKRSVRALAKTAKLFIVPVGVGPILKGFGVPVENIREMDWNEHIDVAGLHIHCLPARHFSGRGVTGRNTTLWASYSLEGKKRRVYFGGDSGEQNEAYEQIGKQHGPFDAAILPIGAYDPLWHDIHLNPEEAVEAYERLDASLFIPCHWATFDLALHGWANPALRLERAVEGKDMPVAWPVAGQRFTLHDAPKTEWWKPLVNTENAVD